MNAYDQLTRRFSRLSALHEAHGVLYWDMQTMMPSGGAEARGAQLATLDALSHELLTAPEVGAQLDAAESEMAELDPWQQANLREMRRTWRHASAVEGRLVEALSVAGTRCGQIWRQARAADDFKAFAPSLSEVVGLVREVAAQKAGALGCEPYDALIDQFEPGMTSARIETLFAPLRERLPALIEGALAAQGPAPALSAGDYPVEAQRALGLRVMAAMGFDFQRGRLDVSAHPFCGGVPDDVRMTTRYRTDAWLSALQGIIHETGHGLYEQGLPRAWRGQPVGQARGMGVHESQSLFWEMQIARSEPFLRWLAPALREELGVEAAVETLLKASNRVERGLIRVDADECTYPAHVMLRFELEGRLLAGSLAVAELPEAWREGMARYVGAVPPDDRDGCMQDIHWTDGSFGYFPSYTLGAMIAAQLAAAMRRDLGPLEPLIGAGDLGPIHGWLVEKVHALGSLHDSDTLIAQATGAPLSAEPFLAHLEARYLRR